MDVTTSPLVAEIHRLQDELDKANESIDEKIDRLEEAGLGVVGLTTELARARAKIVELEERVAKLARSEQAQHQSSRKGKRSHHFGIDAAASKTRFAIFCIHDSGPSI